MKIQRSGFFAGYFLKDLALASLIFFLVALAPYVGAVGLVFVPLPILYYYSKHGRAKGLIILIFSLIVVFISLGFANSYENLPLITILSLAGIAMAEFLKRNYTIEKTVGYSVAAVFFIMALLLLAQAFHLSVAPWDMIGAFIDNRIRYSIRIYDSMNMSAEQVNLIKENIPEIVSFITRIFPALVLVGLTSLVWLNLLAARILFRKYYLTFPDFGDLSHWKPPDRMVWYLIAAGAMLLVPEVRVAFAGWNMLIVVLFLYLLAGLAIISFFLKKSKLPMVFKYLIYILVFAQQIVTLLVAAAGLFDLWVDFRKLNNKTIEDPLV